MSVDPAAIAADIVDNVETDTGNDMVDAAGVVWLAVSKALAPWFDASGTGPEITGLSVLGRTNNVTGVGVSITAGSDGDVLRRSGTSLGFGAIPESSVTGLVSDLASISTALAARPTGSGTANKVTKWTSSTAVGNSSITDTGSLVSFAVDLAINTNKFTVASSTGNTLVAGTLDSTGNFAVNTGKFTVAASTGNTVVDGTLLARGDVQLGDAVGDIITLYGTTIARGGNTQTAPTPLAGFELFGGRSNAGVNDGTGSAKADFAFNYGGSGGGFRHWISTWHNNVAGSILNKMLFYINNGTTAGASSAPGTSNQMVMSLVGSAGGRVGIGTVAPDATLHIENATSVLTSIIKVRALDASGNSSFDFYDESNVNQFGFGYDNLADRAQLSMNASHFSIVDNSLGLVSRWFKTGNVNIGSSTSDPGVLLRVQGAFTATGAVIANSTLRVDGNATIGDAPSTDTHTINGNTVINGAVTGGGGLKVATTTQTNLWCIGDSDNSGSDMAYTGFAIGKASVSSPTEIWYIGRDGTGNTDGLIFRRGGATNDGKIDTSGNWTIGAATTASHTINGRTALTNTTATASALASTFTPVAGTTDAISALVATNNGTFNTTSGALSEYALRAVSSSTRSTGANNLTNVAGYFTASGAQVNVALRTDAGDILLNQTGGTFSGAGAATFTSTLGVTGLATLTGGFTLGADSSAASHKITNLTNGSSAQDAAAFGQIATAVNAAVSGTANTIPKFTGTNVIGNSSVTDNGTTFAINVNKFTVTESNGNTAVAGTLDSTGNFIVNTNKFTVVASSGDTVALGIAYAGATSSTRTYISNHTINFNDGDNATSTGYLNYVGYAGGTTQFRNLIVCDGKANVVATFDGSAKSLAVVGNLSTDANFTAGNSTSADYHTVNGGFTVSSGWTATHSDTINASRTGAGLTLTNVALGRFGDGSTPTFDTTAAVAYYAAVVGVATATRSAGANNLNNTGGYFEASGAQNNYSLYAYNDGVASGDAFAIYCDGKMNVNNTATFTGVASIIPSSFASNESSLTVKSTGDDNEPIFAWKVNSSNTSDGYGVVDAYAEGTFNTTGGALSNYGVAGTVVSTRSAGANDLTNIGGIFSASGAQINYAIKTVDGSNYLNSTSGTTGIGTTPNSDYQLSVARTPSGATADGVAGSLLANGTYNATAADRYVIGVYGQALATRSAGGNNVINMAHYGYAAGGQINYAMYAADGGDVALCSPTDKLAIFGSGGATRQTVTGSRGGNAALASLLTALAAYGIIIDSSS